MGLIARLSRIVPLVILLAVVAAIIYLVVTYRHSPARAKEVLIQVFTWVCGVLSALFGVASVYAFFDNAPAVLDLTLSFMAVGLVGLAITRLCNRRFLKHNPHYRKKRLAATTLGRGPCKRLLPGPRREASLPLKTRRPAPSVSLPASPGNQTRRSGRR